MTNLLQNGDFNDLGKYWTGEHVTYSDNKANIANVGYIQQEVTLSSAIPAGTLVSISFDLSGMYGSSVTVSLNGESFPSIKEEGHHDIAIVVSNDSDTLKLRFRATNAFTLDNVKLFVCT